MAAPVPANGSVINEGGKPYRVKYFKKKGGQLGISKNAVCASDRKTTDKVIGKLKYNKKGATVYLEPNVIKKGLKGEGNFKLDFIRALYQHYDARIANDQPLTSGFMGVRTKRDLNKLYKQSTKRAYSEFESEKQKEARKALAFAWKDKGWAAAMRQKMLAGRGTCLTTSGGGKFGRRAPSGVKKTRSVKAEASYQARLMAQKAKKANRDAKRFPQGTMPPFQSGYLQNIGRKLGQNNYNPDYQNSHTAYDSMEEEDQ